ncbi:MAG: 1-acyl-sn-glycerol-3-phosphate acyltransferase [Staphylococcus sp.]|nr:1-acyl-sn-glycerol-3-phosphate acyltransferase [Staphylococcus sp.]
MEKIICQDGLNRLLSNNSDKNGVDFCKGVIDDLGVTYNVDGTLPQDDTRVIIVSNHPLGGLDGMVLADMVSRQYGGRKNLWFVVNDLLTYVAPLRSIFLGVNKHGKQSREAAARLEEAFCSDAPVVMFPAGLVSRRGDNGVVADLRWNKMVVNKAIAYKRNIIPIHFGGENSQFFYKFAQLRVRLGLKFNIEMIRLPREIFESAGKSFDIHIGTPISWESLRGGAEAQSQADSLRSAVYDLSRR